MVLISSLSTSSQQGTPISASSQLAVPSPGGWIWGDRDVSTLGRGGSEGRGGKGDGGVWSHAQPRDRWRDSERQED
jgi:hypothetical protein